MLVCACACVVEQALVCVRKHVSCRLQDTSCIKCVRVKSARVLHQACTCLACLACLASSLYVSCTRDRSSAWRETAVAPRCRV